MDTQNNNATNFHGYVAYPLEEIAERFLSKQDFSADAIEAGNFAAVMALIVGSHGDTEESKRFLKDCSAYLGKSANEINTDVAIKLFEKFKSIINEKGVCEGV